MTPARPSPSLSEDRSSRRGSPVYTLSANCPSCGYAPKLCQAKAGAFYIGCSDFPRCTFRCPYDPVLQQLRDHNARLQAELTLLQMQYVPSIREGLPCEIEERRRPRTTRCEVAQRSTPLLATGGGEGRS